MSTFTVQTLGRGRRRWVELSRVSFDLDRAEGAGFAIPIARVRYQLHSGFHTIEDAIARPENDATVIKLPYIRIDADEARDLETVSVPLTVELAKDAGYPHAWAARVQLALDARYKAMA